MNYKVFTSESVAAGHPDKICDQVSDALLDATLLTDPKARAGIEVLVTTNHLTIAGEVKIKNGARINYKQIARGVIKQLGYTNSRFGFDTEAKIDVLVHEQNQEIADGVDIGGAGDQGMMFGYAVKETPTLMPLPITLAHELVKKLDEVREGRTIPYLRPDGKSEVTMEYKNGNPVSLERVVLAACHSEEVKNIQLKEDLYKFVVTPALNKFNLKVERKNLIVNGEGIWITPGPATDTGVTGRKVIVDSYGAYGRAGGGCFSGKDPTKVDRSGAYAARYIAKNIVAAGLADKVEIQIAYVIGQPQPIAKDIETFGTEKKPPRIIKDFAWNLLDLSVSGIIKGLDLQRPIYRKTAAYGHFGRNRFPWESIKNF
ncbi:MAG TPA: methionine adenosyltransferase [Candidatus Nanoarchaeia archaeon]